MRAAASRLDLRRDPIPRLVRAIAVPAGTGMLFGTLFNVIDTWWAGRWSTEALAGLSLSFPVFFVVIAASFGFGTATTALVASALGAGEPQRARRIWAQSLLLTVVTGLAIALLWPLVAARLVGVMGGVGQVRDDALAFLGPVLAGAVWFILCTTTNSLLVAQGDTRSFRNALGIACAANMALDPILMWGWGPIPGFGIAGIAYATVLVQVGQHGWLVHKIRRSPLGAAVTLGDFRPRPDHLGRVVRQVGPAVVTMLITGAWLFTLTAFMGRHGGEAIAAFGIGLRIEQVAMLPMLGLTAAATAVVGQNHGAGDATRVHAAARSILLHGFALTLVGGALILLLRHPLVALFTTDPAVRALGATYLGAAVSIFAAYTLLQLGAALLQGLRRPELATAIGLGRLGLGAVILHVLQTAYGLPGVYAGMIGASWIGGIVMLWAVQRTLPPLR